ncbi:hypothetical protein IJI70_01060 [Candidatus Saccharibacteria bacterium]|nr:hypothetical protein [Candidatus Saccharibacteria bacterium]
MKKARLINLGICFSLVLNLFSVVNFTTPVYAEEDDDTEENLELEENSDNEGNEEKEDRIFIKSMNPGFTEVGEFFEIGGEFSGESFLLAGLSIIYTTSSGKDYVVYDFSEGEEMVGESLLFRLKNAPEVKEVGEENYREIADAIYSRGSAGLSRTSGRLRITKINAEDETEEVLDSLCWGLTGDDVREGETCYKTFNADKPTTLVRDETAEEMEDLFVHVENYTPNYDPENPGLIRKEVEREEEIIEPKCRAVAFNEILTYFETSNTEQFVELRSEGEIAVNLDGCLLRYKNKDYELSGTIGAGGILAIYPMNNFGLALTKNPTNSNTLEIIDTDGKVVDKLVYYSGQRKGVAYAQFGYDADGNEQWLQTYMPTPGEENNYQKFKTCPVGKVINEETGNCVNETTLSTTLAACPEGKYRNPLTNRCKSYATTASAELKPCAEGYERNPATGRCRKIVSNDGADYSLVSETFEEKSKFIALYAVIGIVALGVIYILFQYREEIKKKFERKK